MWGKVAIMRKTQYEIVTLWDKVTIMRNKFAIWNLITLWGKVAITRVKIWDIVTLWDIKLQLPETKSHYDIWSHIVWFKVTIVRNKFAIWNIVTLLGKVKIMSQSMIYSHIVRYKVAITSNSHNMRYKVTLCNLKSQLWESHNI